jgi:hypothetical protein
MLRVCIFIFGLIFINLGAWFNIDNILHADPITLILHVYESHSWSTDFFHPLERINSRVVIQNLLSDLDHCLVIWL